MNARFELMTVSFPFFSVLFLLAYHIVSSGVAVAAAVAASIKVAAAAGIVAHRLAYTW